MFFGFWRYSLISAQGFIKIFPQRVEGDFQNINNILTLDNAENSNINIFNKNNSAFPIISMQENIYSFEINLRPENQNIVLPSQNNMPAHISTTTSTTLGTTEIPQISIETDTTTTTSEASTTLNETTTTTIETTTTNLNETTTTISDTTTLPETTTIPETTTTIVETTTTTIPETTTTSPLSKIKTIKPFLSFLKYNFKNINLLGNLADIALDMLNGIESQTAQPINNNLILSGFVLPELLEDEVVSQFSNKDEHNDILNVRLGLSLAGKHINPDSKATLNIEIFNNNNWENIGNLDLNNLSNGAIGSYYYINIPSIDSVEDIETLQVKLSYVNNNLNDQDRLYIDSSWIEIAINSEVENLINDNISETENKLSVKTEEFYNFDQDIIITIPKEQTKIKKIYKQDIVLEDNIVEIKNNTVVIETTLPPSNISDTTTTTSEASTTLNETTTTTIETTTTNLNETTTTISDTTTLPETTTIPETTTTIVETTTTTIPETPAEQPVSWYKKFISLWAKVKHNIVASLEDLVETTTTVPETTTTVAEITTTTINETTTTVSETTTTLNDTTTTIETTSTTSDSTTTLPSESISTTVSDTTTTLLDNNLNLGQAISETTTTIEAITVTDAVSEGSASASTSSVSETTTTTVLSSNQVNNAQTIEYIDYQYQPPVDNSLVIGEELIAMNDFKIRSAILLTPDRKSYRNNISIDENQNEYIVHIKPGPKLIPGKYRLVIKYRDNDELFKYIINFTWGGEILKELQIQDNLWCYFVRDNESKEKIYIQIKSGENDFYHLGINNIPINQNTFIGFIENVFFFIDQMGNLQGFDIINNSLFSSTIDYTRPNFINLNYKKYLIQIENGIISFVKQSN